MQGVGGAASYGVENASVIFRATLEQNSVPLPMDVRLLVAEAPHDNFSLLGRDILYQFTLTVSDGEVTLRLPTSALER